MDSLFTLQYTCLLVFAMLMLQLLVSRLYQNSTTPQYEKSRLLLAATMLILVVHYALQIKFKLRANDDNVGTVFNTLFYPIANYFLACSINTATKFAQNHTSLCHSRRIGLLIHSRGVCNRMVYKWQYGT